MIHRFCSLAKTLIHSQLVQTLDHAQKHLLVAIKQLYACVRVQRSVQVEVVENAWLALAVQVCG